MSGYPIPSVRALHDRAMHCAQHAMVARHEGRFQEAKRLSRQALEYERWAAKRVPNEKASEPTRSILYLSAATLARDCKDFSTVKELVEAGQLGDPSAYIREGFEALLKEIQQEL